MRRIGIDAVGLAPRGGAEVLRDLLVALAEEDAAHPILTFSNLEIGELAHEFKAVESVHVRADSYPARLVWWMTGSKSFFRRARAESVLYLGNIGSIVPPKYRHAILIHQPNIYREMMPQGLRSVRFRVQRQLVTVSARHADTIFVQGPYVARLTKQLLPSASVHALNPGVPSSLGLPSQKQPMAPAEPRPRLTYVGSDAPHKNLQVVEGAAGLIPDADICLTVSASSPTDTATNVRYLGLLDRDEVADLIASSTALVMPSLAETVGLPMLEAMQLGIPVIAADRPYAHAVCGDAALYFDPSNPSSLAEEWQLLLESPALRAQLADAGRRRLQQLDARPATTDLVGWLIGS